MTALSRHVAEIAPLATAEQRPTLAVIVPCYNEGATIADVVWAFRRVLPDATIYVYDNNSTDDTRRQSEAAGAVVRHAPLQGKGNVVRRMFADVEADLYVLVDGDGTYDAAAAPTLIRRLLANNLDMVSGARVSADAEAYRSGHRLGNRALTELVRTIFGRQFADMLTGYRIFSRRFVKSFPAHSAGFEIETEFAVHALQLRLPCAEIETQYFARPSGSFSKLSTIRDGFRILRMIGLLVREERPLQFFASASALSFFTSALLAIPVIIKYIESNSVPRFPSLIVSVGLSVIGILAICCGLILDTVSRARLEHRRIAYLSVPGPGAFATANSARPSSAQESRPAHV